MAVSITAVGHKVSYLRPVVAKQQIGLFISLAKVSPATNVAQCACTCKHHTHDGHTLECVYKVVFVKHTRLGVGVKCLVYVHKSIGRAALYLFQKLTDRTMPLCPLHKVTNGLTPLCFGHTLEETCNSTKAYLVKALAHQFTEHLGDKFVIHTGHLRPPFDGLRRELFAQCRQGVFHILMPRKNNIAVLVSIILQVAYHSV